jgi:hypothetical protein
VYSCAPRSWKVGSPRCDDVTRHSACPRLYPSYSVASRAYHAIRKPHSTSIHVDEFVGCLATQYGMVSTVNAKYSDMWLAARWHVTIIHLTSSFTLLLSLVNPSAGIAGGPNLKASYRRGQAQMGLSQWEKAALDLQQALNLCSPGDGQKGLIQEKLDTARSHLPAGTPLDERPAADQAPRQKVSYNDGSITVEDVTDVSHASSSSHAGTRQEAVGAARYNAARGHEDVAAKMCENPAETQKMIDAMDGMSDTEFEQHARMSGMPGVDRNMAKQVCIPAL